ncbi:MAG: DNA repair protein RadC [Candidatus Amulumruptor caecigallinarius]|nr:DNA repair protein RadC [Candidatus Amulumruptor caecigallinarius]
MENNMPESVSEGFVAMSQARKSDVGYTVKDLHSDEQPRERMKKFGVSSLTESELFAIILRTGTHGFPITLLCRELMRVNDYKLLNLERRSRAELCMVSGIGETKAMQIEAVMEIVRRYNREDLTDSRTQILSPDHIYSLMRPEIANLPHEEIWTLFLNRRNQVIGRLKVSEGSSTGTVCDIKKIIRNALLSHAEGIVMCHNHPSGNLRPSGPDDSITRKMAEACRALEITFVDHLIITTNGFYSYNSETDIIRR